MTWTDVPMTWVLPCAVLFVGMLAAVALLARGRRAAAEQHVEDGTAADSWERLEERRRRKETVYATASYLLLFCCAAVAAALSFHGLVGFGRQNLNLSGGWEYLVPFGLDGAAMFSAVIAVREASHGDASLGSRLLVWSFAAAAAWFNWVHAPRGAEHAGAPQFFAGMSLSAAILFDRALKQTRRAALRERGLVPRPLPQIRFVRWLRAPRETYRAWSLMLLEGVRTLDEAVDAVREERRRAAQERQRRREHGKLERARVKALNRQHRQQRSWRRGPAGSPTTDVEVSAGPAQQTGAPAESPLGAALPPGAESELPRPALQAVTDGGTERRTDPAEGRTRASAGAEPTSQASPRLDSLEEKLAEIERQFS
ncbi:DUF2637 domain-containing protein [Streptomyces oceani]|uniref:DUF2637 domain-containing protein n=1 Tax=Streptomyces oceani TaxID=1075402 RepID=A0A1E7KKI3_9ACTN|nr:DUF2637 domain-containing protein [Streptomyces oceani]OEV04394.1 hypothetical protein AN216_09035 [Streptomyces oceani]